ncbi:uncharacterized protein LOC133126699 [Conger conger]|uniref:uncharacterized protein LOC133126699 n=1 Tax=Conger conger TaxID=82655 RepID=UPI002A5AC80E|nr:uncharacterized protein LOC133126699 [Conger conger]
MVWTRAGGARRTRVTRSAPEGLREENGVTSDQVFHCADAELSWRLLSVGMWPNGSEKQPALLKSGRRCPVLPLVFVHTQEKPSSFEGNGHRSLEGEKSLPSRAALLVDHAATRIAGSLVSQDGSIQCLFLPASVRPQQPVGQGVLGNPKCRQIGVYGGAAGVLFPAEEERRAACAPSVGLLRRYWSALLPGNDRKEGEDTEEDDDDDGFTDEELGLNDRGHGRYSNQNVTEQQCEAEPGSEGEEDVDRVPHAVVETCLLTSLKWLEQQPEATPRQLQLLRELHTLAVRKRERPVRAPVNRRAMYAGGNPHRTRRKQGELSGGVLGTAPSAAPEPNLVEHLIKVEVDDKNLAFGTFLCPDPIGAVTLSEEHVTQGSELEDFNCVKSISDRLKCEPAEIQSVII